MDVSFKDKIVLEAGGTGGLGRSVSLAFLAEGAKTIVTYRNEAEFAALREAAGAGAASLDGHTADVTDEAAVRSLIDVIVSRHWRLDVLVNTVGGYAGGIN